MIFCLWFNVWQIYNNFIYTQTFYVKTFIKEIGRPEPVNFLFGRCGMYDNCHTIYFRPQIFLLCMTIATQCFPEPSDVLFRGQKKPPLSEWSFRLVGELTLFDCVVDSVKTYLFDVLNIRSDNHYFSLLFLFGTLFNFGHIPLE